MIERFLVERAAVAVDNLADPQDRRAGVPEHFFQCRTPLTPGAIAIVGAALAQDVERDERDFGAGAAERDGRLFEINPALQLLKSCRFAVAVEGDDFAVQHERRLAPAGPVFERRRNLRKLMGLLVAESRPETHDRTYLRDGTDPVVLRLV